ncbi:hypothetical protein ABPG74_017672 [Tetrahymena malaccensis]
MDQSDIQFNKICQLHDGQQIKFIQLVNEASQQLDLCSECVTDLNINGQNLLLVEDLLDACNKEIILNWPPLKNKQITDEFERNFKHLEETQENIATFFETFQIDLLKKISDLRKQVFLQLEKKNNENISILQKYNQIADKEKLQQLCKDYFSNSDINGLKFREFINESYQKSSQNEQILNDILDKKFKNSNYEFINELKNLINQITNSIGECFMSYCQDHNNNQTLKQMKFNMMKLIKSLMDIYKTYLNQDEGQNLSSNQSISVEKNNELYLNKVFNQLKQRSFFDFEQMSLIEQIQNGNKSNTENDKLVTLFKQEKLSQIQNIEIQQQLTSFYNQLKYFEDLTQNCVFLQSNQPNNQIYTQFVRDQDKVLKIIYLSETEKTEVYFNKILNFPKNYKVEIKITPFKGFENAYNYRIGFKSQLNSFSDNCFSNSPNQCFQNVKGFNINDEAIRYSPEMRNLELQSFCQSSLLYIYDQPNKNSITQQQFYSYQSDQKVFYISSQHIETIEIIKFYEITQYLSLN